MLTTIKSKIITLTLVLLFVFGLVVVGASCYLTAPIPTFITKQPFFVFQSLNKESISSYFIHSYKNGYCMKMQRIFQEEYWKKENRLLNYFFFHKFFMLATRKNPKVQEIYTGMPHVLNDISKYLYQNPKQPYDEDFWHWLRSSFFLFKINRKSNRMMTTEQNIYHHLINEWQKNNHNFFPLQ